MKTECLNLEHVHEIDHLENEILPSVIMRLK